MSYVTLNDLRSLSDYGSSMPYASNLRDLRSAAMNGNIDQAESLLAQLQQIAGNDQTVTDSAGLLADFNATAAYIQKSVPYQKANQARWSALVDHLVANATALNNDIAYRSSQGNVAGTAAGAAADAEQGGVANSTAGLLNIITGGPGGSSVVDKSQIGKALDQAACTRTPGATWDDATQTCTLPACLTNPISCVPWWAWALGATAVVGVGVVGYVYVTTAARTAGAVAGAMRT